MNYKITYQAETKAVVFVRISDGKILYANRNEEYVKAFANCFKAAFYEDYYIE